MKTFYALLALCAGISPVTGEFPSQRPVTWSFDVFFHLRLIKRLSTQSRRRWFEAQCTAKRMHNWWHYDDATWEFLSNCVHAKNKENIRDPIIGSFWGESPVDFPHKASAMWKASWRRRGFYYMICVYHWRYVCEICRRCFADESFN